MQSRFWQSMRTVLPGLGICAVLLYVVSPSLTQQRPTAKPVAAR